MPEVATLLVTTRMMVCIRLLTIPRDIPAPLLVRVQLTPVSPVVALTTGKTRLALQPPGIRRRTRVTCLRFKFALTPRPRSGARPFLVLWPHRTNIRPQNLTKWSLLLRLTRLLFSLGRKLQQTLE